MRAKTLVIIALVIVMISIFITGCTPEPVSIESITISQSIDSDSAPEKSTNEFPSGTSEFFISIKVSNMTIEDKITIVWNYLETNYEMATRDSEEGIYGSGFVSFNLKPKKDPIFPSGDYNALVYLNDELYETVEFSVK